MYFVLLSKTTEKEDNKETSFPQGEKEKGRAEPGS
jgi:hypothetical protein